MAKRLNDERPYTPLSESLISNVLTPPADQPPAPPADVDRPMVGLNDEPRGGIDRFHTTLKLRIGSRDKWEFEAFVMRLGVALDTSVRPSNIVRAMITVLQNADRALHDLARHEPPIRRPPNDDAVALAEYETRLVRLIDRAVRRSTPLK